jgi:hypothetical protein
MEVWKERKNEKNKEFMCLKEKKNETKK